MMQRTVNRAVLALTAAVFIVVLFSMQLLRTSGKPRNPPISDLPALLNAAEEGDAAALWTLGAVDRLPKNEINLLLPQMLQSDRPEIRAAACNLLDVSSLAHVIPRMSDSDWRVRASAFKAVQRLIGHLPAAPQDDQPLRDTPVEEREKLILEWFAAWRASGSAMRLCDAYASTHWLSGKVLSAECLSCHAPNTGFVEADFADCARCHYPQFESWTGSAHARSTTHLNLAHLNQETKQVELMDFQTHQGLDCVACHQIDERSTAAPPAGTESLHVSHRFAISAATCANCHENTQREWQIWRTNRRPAMATFPPGEIAFDSEPPAKSCVDCHMPRDRLDPQASSHAFAARRDPSFMSAGLHARIEPASEGRRAELVLTNLAGHSFPSGTARRALRIDLMYDDDPRTQIFLLRLCDPITPISFLSQPPLGPGEQRRVALPSRASSRVTCIITFERNWLVPGSYELEIARATGSIE